jgi:16S rRNA (adenine1518-N6/adenine1519-N6)-dimethyltransferase
MTQFTLDQLRRFGISPDTNLGQHFLVDDNILRVIETLSALEPADVVYEPGIGVGVLTDYLAERVAHVHGVELDRRLKPAVDALLGRHANVSVLWQDAVAVQPATLDPSPTKLISNLPYHVAAPIVAEALQHAPGIRRYCVMVQREVADRFFCAVGGSNYGAVSVLLQALTERVGTHNVSRRVFAPPPNVDSTLVAFERRPEALDPGDVPAFAAFVKEAFAQRRKTLANNVSGRAGGREPVVAALAALGKSASARPQELSGAEFIELFGSIG